jgi:hypothetical protein
MQNTIRIGDMYRHFKGGAYKIIAIARDSETTKEVVVYEGQYESPEWGKNPIWVRALDDFLSFKEIDGKKVPRFEKIDQ